MDKASLEKYSALYKKATDLLKNYRYKEALEKFEQAAKIQETLEVYLGVYQCKRSLKHELIPTYKKIIQLDETDIVILNNLAFEYYKKKSYNEAIGIIEKATVPEFESKNGYGIAWATKAEICFKLGDESGLMEALNNCQRHGFDPLNCDHEIQMQYQQDPRYRAILDKSNERKKRDEAWSELTAKTKEEYETKRQKLENYVNSFVESLELAESVPDMIKCIVKFKEDCQHAFGTQNSFIKKYSLNYEFIAVDESRMKALKHYNYPKEFIDWHGSLGHMTGVHGAFTSSTEIVLEELEFEGHAVLKANGFLFIKSDGAGNAFVYDINTTPARILLMDHNFTYSLEDLQETYIDFYNLKKDGDEWLNPNNLDLNKVFTSDRQFRLDSPYIKSILLEEGSTLQSQINLKDFFKSQLLENLDSLKRMHSIKGI